MKKKTDQEFTAGFGKMVKGISSLLLEKDQLSDTQNMMPGFEWEQRRGLSELTGTPVASGLRFKSLVQFRDLQGNTDVILAHTYDGSGGEDLYQGDALPPNAITWTKKYDLTASCTPCQWANVANALLIANSKDFLIWRGNQFYPTGVWKYNSTPADYTIFADELFDNDVATSMPLNGLNTDEYVVVVAESPLDKISPVIGSSNTEIGELLFYIWNGAWTVLLGGGDNQSNASLGNYRGDDLTDWSDGDGGDGASTQVTFDNKSTFKFDSGSGAGNYAARDNTTMTTTNVRCVVTARIYLDLVGTQADNDSFQLTIINTDGDQYCGILFCSDGLFAYDGAAWNEVGTDLTSLDTWETWTFDWDMVAETVDIYLEGVSVASDVDVSRVGGFVANEIKFQQNGPVTANQIAYVDWVTIGIDLVDGDDLVDGTYNAAATLNQSGDITWTARTDEVQTDVQGVPGFAYKMAYSVVLSNPTSVTGLNAHSPIGSVQSVWDGFYEFVSGCYVNDGTDNTDYTAYVNNIVEGQYMDLSLVDAGDIIYVGFPTRVNKIIFHPASNGKNTGNVSINSIKYHNTEGAATTVGSFTDTMETNNATFSQKGYLAWGDVGWQNEKMTVIGGDLTPMYWYEIIVDAALDDPTYIYHIQGVPIPKDPDPAYGVFAYKRRAWQIAPRNKENTVRFSAQDLPNVWVGRDSGYVKMGERPLFAAGAFYNETVLFADTEMWMLQGNAPQNFGRLRLSSKVGIAAPKSLVPVESGVIVSDTVKVVLAWQFFDGFWMFDGVRIQKISSPDIDSFFDPEHDDYINPSYLDKTYGEYDFVNQVVMWSVFSGSGATTPTKVVCLHFPTMNYGIFDYGTDIEAMLSVINNKYYMVGGGHSDGRFYQLDSGITDYVSGTATAVTAYVITKDEFLSLSSGLRSRLMSVWSEAQTDGGQIELYEYPDGSKTPQLVAKKSMTVMGKIFGVLQETLRFFPGQKTTKMKIQNTSKNARMKLIGHSTTADEDRGNE